MEKKKLPRWARILIRIVMAIAIIILFALGAILGLRAQGLKRLMAKTAEVPVIVLDTPSVSEASVEAEPAEEPLKEGEILYKGVKYAYKRELVSILVMGIDKAGAVKSGKDGIDGGQADALFLLLMDPAKKSLSVIGINRNTMAQVDIYNRKGEYLRTESQQICLQHGFGNGLEESCERQCICVSRFMHEIPIHAYLSLNYDSIPQLNDAIGGVTLEALEDIRIGKRSLKAGETVTLAGQEALDYVRSRDMEVFDSSTARFQRQKQYLGAASDRLREMIKENPGSVMTLYGIAKDYMVTDIDVSQLTYLATEMAACSFGAENVFTLPGETCIGEDGFEEYHVDDEAVKDIIVQTFYDPVE